MSKVCVVGLGYVGIPVAAKFAEAGHGVTGIDIDEGKVEKINRAEYPLKGQEPGIQDLLEKVVSSDRLKASTDFGECGDADFITICVQTPLKDDNPDNSYLESACEEVGRSLTEGCVVSVESTLAPRTMAKVVKPILERSSGLRAGKDFYLVHCPERVRPGHLLEQLETFDRVIGGIDKQSALKAKDFYKDVINADLDITDMTTAEVVKTTENAYRDTQIAFANEIALLSEEVGIDVFEVRNLVNKCPWRDMHIPGTGVGGHCIPVDPLLLISSVQGTDIPKVIPASRNRNDEMPRHLVELITEEIDPKSKVSLLGLSYVKDTEDARNSPALVVKDELEDGGYEVSVHDPWNEDLSVEFEECLKGSSCLVLATDHSAFERLKPEGMLKKIKNWMDKPFIADGRNFFDKKKCEKLGFTYRGIGKGK
ncbi:hypothetical protein AKJ57_01215 [candidate division MSBL1 archaeon SCGC-AAA259A05]|uniref:UDP-N-acetyl-D-mannosamine dehydrogenase n=1 Tax=candidate division MSBL1 archaeon SCGC-AAA259A05 TaxID=1698259 RepID=A0A133UB38_9EURY|nr:hypothetical protein AKJ57_01215 [candidate division MSBL1 archaeon SCGC-AAA259A05]